MSAVPPPFDQDQCGGRLREADWCVDWRRTAGHADAGRKTEVDDVRVLVSILAFAASCGIMAAQAGELEAGQKLAQNRCAACHVVGNWRGDVVAVAPPFEAIARKYPTGTEDLVIAMLGPHPRMNFRPTESEARAIALYMRSLVP